MSDSDWYLDENGNLRSKTLDKNPPVDLKAYAAAIMEMAATLYVLMHDWHIDDICVATGEDRKPILFDTKEEAERYGESSAKHEYFAEKYDPDKTYVLECDLEDERGHG
jgi:hypothetical protein